MLEILATLFAKDSSGLHTIHLNHGLFSTISFKKDDYITEYKGEFIGYYTMMQRIVDGKQGYMIHFNDAIFDSNNKLIKEGLWLDCYESRWKNECKASLANSCTNAKIK